jgi:hypothetical protein
MYSLNFVMGTQHCLLSLTSAGLNFPNYIDYCLNFTVKTFMWIINRRNLSSLLQNGNEREREREVSALSNLICRHDDDDDLAWWRKWLPGLLGCHVSDYGRLILSVELAGGGGRTCRGRERLKCKQLSRFFWNDNGFQKMYPWIPVDFKSMWNTACQSVLLWWWQCNCSHGC